ncbi:starch branching enzyme I, partial [Tanacetum coccineum]
SSTPVSWLDSHTESVIAAMLGVWHRCRICKSEPHLLLSHPNSRLKQSVNYSRQKMASFEKFIFKHNNGVWVDWIPAWIKYAIVDSLKFVASYDGFYRDPPASERYSCGAVAIMVSLWLSSSSLNLFKVFVSFDRREDKDVEENSNDEVVRDHDHESSKKEESVGQDKVEEDNGVRSSDDGVENESEKDDVDESNEKEDAIEKMNETDASRCNVSCKTTEVLKM